MSRRVTQQDVQIAVQHNKVITYKVEILDFNLKVLDVLEGDLISGGLSISADSDVRRTYSCELMVSNSSFLIGRDTKIWFDRLIRHYIGILNERTQEVVWYLLGTYLFTDTNYSYNSTTKKLSLNCVDLMCLLNDNRKGQLDQYQRKLKEDSDVRTIITDLLTEAGITKYYIEFNINGERHDTFTLPYEKTYEAGATVYQIISELIELYPCTQMYFDIDGVFNIRPIPTRSDEQCVLTDDVIRDLVIEESSLSSSFNNIYNKVIIWGKVNEADYYTTDVTVQGNCYNANVFKDTSDADRLNWISYDQYFRGDKISIRVPTTNQLNQSLNVNNLGSIPIVYDNGKPIEANLLDPNCDYVFRYRDNDGNSKQFVLLGSYQCYGEAYLTNNMQDASLYAVKDLNSDLSIEKIGTITKVLSGGDFDNIYTDSLTIQRCKYELYNYINQQESLNLSMVLIPWLDVNDLIEYTPNTTKIKSKYLVKSIDVDLAQYTMTVSLVKYHPEYLGGRK